MGHSIGLLGTQGDIPNRKLMTREYVLFLELCSHPFLLHIQTWAHLITFPYSLINIYKTIKPEIALYINNLNWKDFQIHISFAGKMYN